MKRNSLKNVKLLSMIAACLLSTSVFVAIPAFSAQPPIDKSTYYVGAVGQPSRLDPARAYDTASGELIQNVYEPLIWYGDKRPVTFTPGVGHSLTAAELSDLSVYVPIIATRVPTEANGGIINNASGGYWTFTVNTNAQFPSWTAANGTVIAAHNVTVADVVYSFQRQLVYDSDASPDWLWIGTAFNPSWTTFSSAFSDFANGTFVDATVEGQVAALIQGWVYPSGGTNVAFHFLHPYADVAMYQIFAQTWGSVLEKAWVIEHGGWNGTFYKGWSNDYRRKPSNSYSELDQYKDPAVYGPAHGSKYTSAPHDIPSMLGTGPYLFTSWDTITSTWRIDYNPNYWKGWTSAGDKAGNYIKTVIETRVADWPTRKMLFLTGDFDEAVVPRANMYDLLTSTYNPIAGINMAYNIPLLINHAFFFTMNVSIASPYQSFVGYPTHTTGQQALFFADQHIRRAFAWAMDYSAYISNAYGGEAVQHGSWWVTGLTPTGADDSFLTLRTLSLANMKAELNQAALINGRNVSVDGFDVTFLYNTGNEPRRIAAQALADAWQSLGSKYHVNVVGVDWSTYSSLLTSRSMPGYANVWSADFADAADFAGTYMGSSPTSWFSYLQGPPYPADQAVIDAEITQAATETNVAARVNLYRDLETRYYTDCISISLDQPVSRRFARDWVQGWYYNPLLPGLYAYDLYKFPAVDWWPMFHHDLTHTGYSTSIRAPNTNQVLWNYLTGGWVASAPAVVDGIVYVGSGDWNVYALNASTGQRIWWFPTNAPVYSSPAVADGKVYVGSGNPYPYWRLVGWPPTYTYGYWWIGGIYCLDALTGSVIWSNTTLGFPVESSPAVADGMVFIGGCNTASSGSVNAYSASNGALVWSVTTGGWVISSPAVNNGVVFVGSNGITDVYALSEFTGAVIWSRALGGYVDSSPAVDNGKVYVGVCSMSNTVFALNEVTGATIWSFNTGAWVESSPAVFGGTVFVGCNNWNVYALSASTGALIWKHLTVGKVTSSPAVADGKVYVGSWNGNGNAAPAPFYCLNASTGAFIWSYQTNSAFFDGSPSIVGGVVYVGACQPDNHTYAFESSTTVQAYCNTAGASVNVGIALDGSPTGFTTPHTFTSLSTCRLGNHTITVPITDSSGHPFKNWNTGETTPTITVKYAGFTYIAFYQASVRRDVAVTNLVCSKTVVGQNYTLYVTVTVENQGDVTETFNVTTYYNQTAITIAQWPDGTNSQTFWSNGDVNRDGYIDNWDLYTIQNAFGSLPGNPRWNPDADINNDGVVNAYDIVTCNENYGKDIWTSLGLPKLIQSQRTVTLANGNSANVTFRWNTTGVVYGTYTIKAYAGPVPGETDTADNTLTDGTIYVGIPGDIFIDIYNEVDILDAIRLATAYNSMPGNPNWNANADINSDGVVDLYDAMILAGNYGRSA